MSGTRVPCGAPGSSAVEVYGDRLACKVAVYVPCPACGGQGYPEHPEPGPDEVALDAIGAIADLSRREVVVSAIVDDLLSSGRTQISVAGTEHEIVAALGDFGAMVLTVEQMALITRALP